VKMRRLVIGLGMALGMTVLLHGQTTAKAQNSNTASPKTAKAEQYRDLTSSDQLSCGFGDSSLQGNIGSTDTSGTVQSFGCDTKEGKGKLIALKSKNIVDGKLETMAFGTILVGTDNRGNPEFFMKESQIKRLRAFLGF
jgi:hypothetical protein